MSVTNLTEVSRFIESTGVPEKNLKAEFLVWLLTQIDQELSYPLQEGAFERALSKAFSNNLEQILSQFGTHFSLSRPEFAVDANVQALIKQVKSLAVITKGGKAGSFLALAVERGGMEGVFSVSVTRLPQDVHDHDVQYVWNEGRTDDRLRQGIIDAKLSKLLASAGPQIVIISPSEVAAVAATMLVDKIGRWAPLIVRFSHDMAGDQLENVGALALLQAFFPNAIFVASKHKFSPPSAKLLAENGIIPVIMGK